MAEEKNTNSTVSATEEEQQHHQLELSLPKRKGFLSPYVYLYHNFWCPSTLLRNVVSVRTRFEARPSDLLLITKPKSGTTWLKALAFAILNRGPHPAAHPLLSANPHILVPVLECSDLLHLSQLPSPRLLSTHLPYAGLPQSVSTSGCRVVYLCRNPLDSAVSFWKYSRHILKQDEDEDASSEMEEYLDSVCNGFDSYGPYWDHVLGFWNESLSRPDKVLFMEYEDIKKDEGSEITRLAAFLGAPFSQHEVDTGVIEQVRKMCSLRSLKELDVNKSGEFNYINNVGNKAFFRKGEVGDWVNHLTPPMVNRLNQVMQDKFRGTGFSYKL